MANETTGSAKNKNFSQLFLVAANAFSLVYAVEVGLLAVYVAIRALITGGAAGGVMAYVPLWLGLSAGVFGLIALLTVKKITDQELLKKAYNIVAAFVLAIGVLAATGAVGAMLFSLFAVGVGAIQATLWLDMFLPMLCVAGVAVGFLVIAKKIASGMTKMLPVVAYVIFGIAGIALILAIVATFVGLYGGSSSYYTPSYNYNW
jgi:hypothetical protein